MKPFDQRLDLELEEIYNSNGIDGFDDLIDSVANVENGILSNMSFSVVGTTADGLIRVRVIADIIEY